VNVKFVYAVFRQQSNPMGSEVEFFATSNHDLLNPIDWLSFVRRSVRIIIRHLIAPEKHARKVIDSCRTNVECSA